MGVAERKHQKPLEIDGSACLYGMLFNSQRWDLVAMAESSV